MTTNTYHDWIKASNNQFHMFPFLILIVITKIIIVFCCHPQSAAVMGVSDHVEIHHRSCSLSDTFLFALHNAHLTAAAVECSCTDLSPDRNWFHQCSQSKLASCWQSIPVHAPLYLCTSVHCQEDLLTPHCTSVSGKSRVDQNLAVSFTTCAAPSYASPPPQPPAPLLCTKPFAPFVCTGLNLGCSAYPLLHCTC